MDKNLKELRKRLLNWHYQKSRSIGIVDLLESDYQRFRYKVGRRVNNTIIDFREALKIANYDELRMLEQTRDEKRLGI